MLKRMGLYMDREAQGTAYAMVALHSSFDDENKRRLQAVVESHINDFERLRVVAGVLDGRLSADDLETDIARSRPIVCGRYRRALWRLDQLKNPAQNVAQRFLGEWLPKKRNALWQVPLP